MNLLYEFKGKQILENKPVKGGLAQLVRALP